MTPSRRSVLLSLSALLARAAGRLPQNKNVKWALSLGLWQHFPKVQFTDVLDVMRDTGFIGLRLTSYPGFLRTYDITPETIEREMKKRGLEVATLSFAGPAHDPAQREKYLKSGRDAMTFLKKFGANRLVCFSPNRSSLSDPAFRTMCQNFNRLGEIAGEMGFRAGVHSHLDQMVETAEDVDRCMELTDPKLFGFAPDTAHLFLAGADVKQTIAKYRNRLVFLDYKDARWTEPAADFKQPDGHIYRKETRVAKFFSSIYDLGDGDVDLPAVHQILKSVHYRGWICVDLDVARSGPRTSFERCGKYIVSKLEPIYS